MYPSKEHLLEKRNSDQLSMTQGPGLIIGIQNNTTPTFRIQNKLKNLSEKTTSLEKELEELKNDNFDLLLKNEELYNKIISQEEEIETQKKEIEQLRNIISDYDKKKKMLDKDLEQSTKTISHLNGQIADLEEENQKLNLLITSLKDQLTILQNDKQILNDKVDKQSKQIIDIQSDNNKLRNNVDELNATIKKQDGKIENQTNGISRLNLLKINQGKELKKVKEELEKQRELIDNLNLEGSFKSNLKENSLTYGNILELKLGEVTKRIRDFIAILTIRESDYKDDEVNTMKELNSLIEDTDSEEVEMNLKSCKKKILKKYEITKFRKTMNKLRSSRNVNAYPDISELTDNEILQLSEDFVPSGLTNKSVKEVCELYILLKKEVYE